MRIESTRQVYTKTAKQLRRARCLFVFLNRRRLMSYGDDYMDLFVGKCKEYQFYSTKRSDKDIRYSVLRKLYKIHNPDDLEWHQWYAKYHWRGYTWKRFA